MIFLGIFLTGFGSSYYHWNPNDSTLFWDRLPMTLSFMAILAVVVEERISARLGAVLLWPLLATGLLSLLLWRSTGDLRLYGWVQFFSLPGSAAAAFAVPAQIYRHLLLAHRRGALRARQIVRVCRSSGPFELHPQRTHDQASLRSCCLFRDTEILSDAPANYGIAAHGFINDTGSVTRNKAT